MALIKVAAGGCGGRLGHSNMSHWTGTDEIKACARKFRRRAGLEEIAAELEVLAEETTEIVALQGRGRYPSVSQSGI